MSKKLKDLRSFFIPCHLGNNSVSRAQCDLGASINLISLPLFRKFNSGEMQPTTIFLQMVDRSIAHLYGIVDDMLVKVDKFIFPVDFVVLDMEEDANILIILRRPFLATERALIDVEDGKLTFKLNNEEVTFDIYKALKHPDEISHEQYITCKVVNSFTPPSKCSLNDSSSKTGKINYMLSTSNASGELEDPRKHASSFDNTPSSYMPLKPKMEC